MASGRAWTGRSLEDVQDRELVLEEGEARTGRCGGAARRWNKPIRPCNGGAGLLTPLKAQRSEELAIDSVARTYRPK